MIPAGHFVRIKSTRFTFAVVVMALLLCSSAMAADWSGVRAAMQEEGKLDSGVLVFKLARTELTPQWKGVSLKPPFVFQGMVAFQDIGSGNAIMTFELPVRQGEVMNVVRTLRNNKLDISAIHNHEILEDPRAIYIHGDRVGNATTLAEAIAKALKLINNPQKAGGMPAGDPEGINMTAIHEIIGGKDEALPNDTYEIMVERKESSTLRGRAAMPPLGFESHFYFQSVGGGTVGVNCEFILRAEEVNPVISILKENGFTTSALHNHFLTDSPRWFFVHAAHAGDQVTLAKAIRAALLRTNSK